jgi:hypoxanthine phosphoribosyltransferase
MMDIKPTYNEIHAACVSAAKQLEINGHKIERVVGLVRGGLMPAVIMSHCLNDIPMTAISYSSKSGNGDNKNHTNVLPDIEENTILICDDIVDTGYSMREVVDHYIALNKVCVTFALYSKETAVFKPDYAWRVVDAEETGWIVFPFELGSR